MLVALMETTTHSPLTLNNTVLCEFAFECCFMGAIRGTILNCFSMVTQSDGFDFR